MAAGLDPLSRRAAAELPQSLSCIQLRKAWPVSVNRNKWLWSLQTWILLYFCWVCTTLMTRRWNMQLNRIRMGTFRCNFQKMFHLARVWSYVSGMVLNLKKCLKGSSVGRRRNTFPFACSRGLPLPELLPVFCTKLAARARRFKWNLAEQRHFMFELRALSLPHQPGWAFLWNKVNKYSQAVFCKLTSNKW